MVDEQYRFDDGSYDAVGRAGVDWQSVIDVLFEADVRIRQRIGVAVLLISAPNRHDRWLRVALVEESDDEYLVTGARWLEADEAEAAKRLVG